jgi:Winged helix-turn helix
MRRRPLILTDTQHAELVALRDHDHRPYLRERAAALLRIAAGESPYAVARQGILKPRAPDTVYDWLDRYEAQGIAGLIQLPRGHRGFSPSRGRRTRDDRAADA